MWRKKLYLKNVRILKIQIICKKIDCQIQNFHIWTGNLTHFKYNKCLKAKADMIAENKIIFFFRNADFQKSKQWFLQVEGWAPSKCLTPPSKNPVIVVVCSCMTFLFFRLLFYILISLLVCILNG